MTQQNVVATHGTEDRMGPVVYVPPPPPTETNSILAVIERAALDPSIDIDKMERLLDMHERIQERQKEAAYCEALACLQADLPTIKENGTITNKEGRPQSHYALWEDIVAAITPVLSKWGLSLSFRILTTKDSITVTGVLAHKLGHSERTEIMLPLDTSGSKNVVQGYGSSVSYGKRYTAGALLNLRSGLEQDDDGQATGPEYVSEEQLMNLEALITELKINTPMFLRYMKADSLAKIPAKHYKNAVAALESRRGR